MMQRRTLLFWDVDGTLLTTARAGIHAWEQAVLSVVGIPADLTTLRTAGLTDVEISYAIMQQFGVAVSTDTAQHLVRAYEAFLPRCLALRRGQVLPGVREILEALRERSDVISLLLTGNTRAGAAVKLNHYQLASFFVAGAYADDGKDRVDIARSALVCATRLVGGAKLGPFFVIGDTPYDIRCGKAIGARTLAVATGSYSVSELAAQDPWRVLKRLPRPDTFVELIGLPGERRVAT